METKQGKKHNKTNPILWFLFAIIIPLTLAISLTLFILNLSGVDVTGWTKDKLSQVPVVSVFVTNSETQEFENKIERTESKVEQKSSEIETLTQTKEELEAQITKLEDKISKMESEQRNDLTASVDVEEQENRDKQTYKNMASSFKKMDQKQAAAIFEQLETDIAIKILTEMPNDVRGNVLEGMDPEKAAALAEIFVE